MTASRFAYVISQACLIAACAHAPLASRPAPMLEDTVRYQSDAHFVLYDVLGYDPKKAARHNDILLAYKRKDRFSVIDDLAGESIPKWPSQFDDADELNAFIEKEVEKDAPLPMFSDPLHIPDALLEKATQDIDAILAQGHAKSVSKADLYHLHILLPMRYFDSRRKPDAQADNPHVLFLYHTQEEMPSYPSRNLVSTLKSRPIVIPKPRGRDTIYPVDLKSTPLVEVTFAYDADGVFELRNGRRLRFVLTAVPSK